MNIPTQKTEKPKPPFELITGPAGSGKTYTLRKRMENYKDKKKKYATLTATTGIAAINLSGGSGETVTTINSQLGYFDTTSLIDSAKSGRLHKALRAMSKVSRNVSIDEISMMDKIQLDVIRQGVVEVNEEKEVFNRGGLGLILSGDFCQLPPVKGEFCFNAKCWKDVDITRLEKVYRQSDPKFLDMLNAARCGNGELAAQLIYGMKDSGVKVVRELDPHFDGTTIVPLNKHVDYLNEIRLKELIGKGEKQLLFKSRRWGKQLGEWKNVPDERVVCTGAYVMILANDAPDFTYANGSCGHVRDGNEGTGRVIVQLVEGREVEVRKVTRKCFSRELPPGYQEVSFCGYLPPGYLVVSEWLSAEAWAKTTGGGRLTSDAMDDGEGGGEGEESTNGEPDDLDLAEEFDGESSYKTYLANLTTQSRAKYGPCKPYFDYFEGKWVMGEITYTPIRLAYASTVHKCVSPDSIVVEKKKGLIKADCVAIGDSLFDGDSYVQVTDKAYRESTLTCIKTQKGFELTVSPEHPILIFDGGFIEAKYLQAGQWVKTALDYRIPLDSPYSSDFYWLLGALVGDGSYTDTKEGNVHFCNRNLYMLDRVKRCVEKEGIHFGLRSDGDGGFFTSKPFREKLASLGLEYQLARFKTIPHCVLEGGREAIRSFLCGLMDTDGSVAKSGVVITMVGKELAKQVHQAFLAIGIFAKRGFYETAYGDYYQVYVGAAGLLAYKQLVGFSKPDKRDKLAALCPNRIIEPWTGYDRIISVENTTLVHKVVNFTTESQRFLCDGIVTHNSQGLSLDKIQIDYSHEFFGEPSMSYVALSRCRTPEGLTIVGNARLIEERTNISSEILPWI